MKRLVPLWICALGGFVLIVAYFIPETQSWGEIAAIWFDILAAIAFILGGGNLLKVHLKKTSDRTAGWGYSVLTLVSFLVMLYVGLVKWGAPPASNQEFYGQSFAKLPLASLPASYSVSGTIPARPHKDHLHYLVREQTGEADGQITFHGWMRSDQRSKLAAWDDSLAWQCLVDNLYAKSQPPDAFKGKLNYYADRDALGFKGHMTEAQRAGLLAMNGDANWQEAVDKIYNQSQTTFPVNLDTLPTGVEPANLPSDVSYDPAARQLQVLGPLTPGQRSQMLSLAPIARPMDAAQREELIERLSAGGPLDSRQRDALNRVLDGSWTVAQLHSVLDAAGKAPQVARTACQMLKDQEDGVDPIPLTSKVGNDVTLNSAQVGALQAFVDNPSMTLDELSERISKTGDWVPGQQIALDSILSASPTVGERNKALAIAMMQTTDDQGRSLPLNAAQRKILLDEYAAEAGWRRSVDELYVGSHKVKYKWSGEYRAQGSPFWWLYEYVFKPLQATIFAMLAFYVASAAFRAFRAKNIEAILLLGTAFIILLGRTYAGVVLTQWMPESLSGLKIENLTVYIMQVFNTAGNRAIMIGIALGITSTSLKVLLGVDRSYLGSGDE
jgi:hypothetical protein